VEVEKIRKLKNIPHEASFLVKVHQRAVEKVQINGTKMQNNDMSRAFIVKGKNEELVSFSSSVSASDPMSRLTKPLEPTKPYVTKANRTAPPPPGAPPHTHTHCYRHPSAVCFNISPVCDLVGVV